MEYKTSAQLKEEVKTLFRGRWKDAILLNLIPIIFTIVFFIIVYIITGAYAITYFNEFTNEYAYRFVGIGGILMFVFTIVYVILVLVTASGVQFTYLDWLRNPELEINPVKDSLQIIEKKQTAPFLILNLVIYIFTGLWTLLLYIPGIIKTFSYSQALFIFKDVNDSSLNNNMSTTDYVTESRRLMDGHKGRLLYITLSFIGWAIVGSLTFGIAYIWIYPYMSATFSAFYKDLAKEKFTGTLINDEDIY